MALAISRAIRASGLGRGASAGRATPSCSRDARQPRAPNVLRPGRFGSLPLTLLPLTLNHTNPHYPLTLTLTEP